MILVDMTVEHVEAITGNMQPMQADFGPNMTPEYVAGLLKFGKNFAALYGDRVLAIGGTLELWTHRLQAWALLSNDARRHLLPLTRIVRAYFAVRPETRIETAVKTNFLAGHRWARMCGFEREGTMRGYTEAGDDYDLYAMVKPWPSHS